MKQVFRLMGMPDKMIAFDELPSDLLEDVEWRNDVKLPRHWKDFIGMRERNIKVSPDRDPVTGQVRTYVPLVEKSVFTFVLDRELNKDMERWKEIEGYVRRNAPLSWEQVNGAGEKVTVRLMDNLDDMAQPMAPDVHSEMTLEPEEVIVIPLKKEDESAQDGSGVSIGKQEEFPCVQCERIFDTKQGLRMHVMKRHPVHNLPNPA